MLDCPVKIEIRLTENQRAGNCVPERRRSRRLSKKMRQMGNAGQWGQRIPFNFMLFQFSELNFQFLQYKTYKIDTILSSESLTLTGFVNRLLRYWGNSRQVRWNRRWHTSE